MKILHIINGLAMGGAENLLVGLAGTQVMSGNEVTVAPLVCPEYTIIREKLESLGVSVKPFKASGSVYSPSFIPKIVNLSKQFDVIHVHLFPSLYWAGLANLFNGFSVPFVFTEHSTNNRRRNNRILHWTDFLVYKYCYNRIIACADKVLDSFKSFFPSVRHCCTINNGVNIASFTDALPYTKKTLLGINETDFVIIMVARFMSMKRQDTVVEALSKLPDTVHVAFVGGNENDDGLIRIKKIANDLNLSERVHFLYTRNDVPKLLKTADVILMASDYEGLSLSSIEGMAAGKPFIASDVDGLREVVGGAGVLYKNKDSNELARLIFKLYKEKDYYEEIRNQCLERAKQYDINRMLSLYYQVYSEVVKV